MKDPTWEISNHSGSRDFTELMSLHAYLSDNNTSKLTNNKINRSIDLLIKTFDMLVELSLLHPQRNSEYNILSDGGFYIDHTKEIEVGYSDSNVKMYFSIYVIDRKRPYIITKYPLTEKHEEILYKHLSLKIKEKISDEVVELTWT